MPSELTNWELFHAYRRLVDKGLARPLLCPECEGYLITRIGIDDEPILWCYGCLSSLRPGLDLLTRVRAVVTEHYVW
jgi:hypothetical protein